MIAMLHTAVINALTLCVTRLCMQAIYGYPKQATQQPKLQF